MSLRSLFDRTVQVVAVSAGSENAHGNRTRTAAAGLPVRARRDQTAATEDRGDRDQQTETVLYLLDLRALDEDRTLLELGGRDRIVDGDDTFEIVGQPELARRRRRPHHWEARAELVAG